MTKPSSFAQVSAEPTIQASLRQLRRFFLVFLLVMIYLLDMIHYVFFPLPRLADMLVTWVIVAFGVGVARLMLTTLLNRVFAEMERINTERRSAAAAVHQLEAVQATTLTVAHTINQPLTVIAGYAAILHDELTDPDQIACVGKIADETQRAADLIRELRGITRYVTVPYASGARMLDIGKPYQSDS